MNNLNKKIIFIDIKTKKCISEDFLKNFSQLPMVDEDIATKEDKVLTIKRILHSLDKDIFFVKENK